MTTMVLQGPERCIGPTMTANAVMRRFPETVAVFGRYGVVPGVCGCDCLDELAWHRGLDAAALIQELEAAVRRAELAVAAEKEAFTLQDVLEAILLKGSCLTAETPSETMAVN